MDQQGVEIVQHPVAADIHERAPGGAVSGELPWPTGRQGVYHRQFVQFVDHPVRVDVPRVGEFRQAEPTRRVSTWKSPNTGSSMP